jgi:hypothetical protein
MGAIGAQYLLGMTEEKQGITYDTQSGSEQDTHMLTNLTATFASTNVVIF